MSLFEERRRSFEHCAMAYAANRPDYPEVLFDDIITFAELEPGAHAIEVGAGTGIASRPFLERGLRLTLVEPAAAMAAEGQRLLAAYGGTQWRVQRFEDITPRRPHFDLLYAASSVHWIPPTPGYRLMARHVGPGGPIVILGNAPAEQYDSIQPCYAEHAPELARSEPLPPLEDRLERRCDDLESTGDIEVRSLRTYPWELRMPARRYAGMLSSYSDHAALPPDRREALLGAIEAQLAAEGGARRPMVAYAIHARALDATD